MRFGFITHVGGDPARGESITDAAASARLLQDAIELAVLAEERGFDSFWVAEHHFGAQNGHCPSPLVLLAAIAQRTSRIRLGTAVLIGSIEDPIMAGGERRDGRRAQRRAPGAGPGHRRGPGEPADLRPIALPRRHVLLEAPGALVVA